MLGALRKKRKKMGNGFGFLLGNIRKQNFFFFAKILYFTLPP